MIGVFLRIMPIILVVSNGGGRAWSVTTPTTGKAINNAFLFYSFGERLALIFLPRVINDSSFLGVT